VRIREGDSAGRSDGDFEDDFQGRLKGWGQVRLSKLALLFSFKDPLVGNRI
jgi:hypothetical protein